MKLRRLHINSFGHFTDFDLPLDSDGLQVIYGPNEAGKTTLLEFLRGWLFDFPVRTPYAFKGGAEIAGVGTLILSDGRCVELRRRKGNKNKVSIKIDELETDLDDVGFQRLIGHANQSLFESVFSFGLDQLSSGKENLKHESLQSALFGGGLGTATSPDRILQDLDEQAGRIFDGNPRKNTSIKSILKEMDDLQRQIKSKGLRPDNYQKCRQAAVEAKDRAAELNQQFRQMRLDHLRIDKLCRAHQKWAELQQRRADRELLSVPGTLPVDAGAKYAALKEKLQASTEEAEPLTGAIASLERELSLLKQDPESVKFRAEIRALLELRQSYLEARRDLPKLKMEHAATRQQIDRELQELRPGWGPDDLQQFSIDVATRSEIERLVDEHQDLVADRTELQAKRDQLAEQLKQARADLESLGQAVDASPLAAIVVDEAAYAGDRKQLEQLSGEATKVERLLATRLKKLSPSLPASLASPLDAAVPRIDIINQFEADFAGVGEPLRATSESIREDERQLTDLQEVINQTATSGAIPTLEERDAARRRRDDNWRLIRSRFLEGKSGPPAGSEPGLLGDLFEQSLHDTDRLDDLIYANADAVARREELLRQSESLTRRIAQKEIRVGELQKQLTKLQQQWKSLWSACEFEPPAPEVMRRWLIDYETVCETVARRDEIAAEIEPLQRRIEAFEQKLRVTSGAEDGDIRVLLAAAHQAVDEAKEHQRRTKELHRDIKRTESQQDDCRRELDSLASKESSWRLKWQSVLHRLHLPAEWDPELAGRVIERLSATRVKLDALPQEESRLAAMQSRLDEFESGLQPLCEALRPDLLREPLELAAEKLSDQLEQAVEAAKQHEQLGKQLRVAREQRNQAVDRLTQWHSERTVLFAAADVASEEQFLEVIQRADRIRQLDSDLKRLSSDLDQIRAGEVREEFERSLSELDSESLTVRNLELAEQLEDVERQGREADGDAAVKASELARLDGSAAAALLTDDLSRKRANLSSEIDRYIPLLFARHLLSEAVKRFDRENQPEMIRTISRLMTQMTGGRYIKFDRATDSSQSILVRRYDGVERKPEQLSTGTREQLYLAIRLAYVLHYCRQNEPLPIVMDDVLVNFDDNRARQTLIALSDVARSVQVLFFTCHPHTVQLALNVAPDLEPIELPAPAILA